MSNNSHKPAARQGLAKLTNLSDNHKIQALLATTLANGNTRVRMVSVMQPGENPEVIATLLHENPVY